MIRYFKTLSFFVSALIAAVLLVAAPTLADPSKSNNFQLIESALGGNSQLGANSSNFQLQSSSGLIGIGNTASSGGTQINAGHLTTGDPALAFAVTAPNANFTSFDPTVAATATSTFEVTDYTSYGYAVQVFGTPPTNGTHTLSAMGTSSPAASQVGIEQFGINLVANVSPTNFGSNPSCSPDSSFCPFSNLLNLITTNYKSANVYRFVDGETIVNAPKSSGKIIYTISYVVNVSSVTPGGQYNGNQTLLVTGTY